MSTKQPKSDEFIVSDTDSSSNSDADTKSRKTDSRKKVKSLKKNRSSNSDASDNDEVIPKKKERKEKSSSDKEKHKSDPEDDKRTEWNLSKNRKIRLNEFKGKMLIDIREYYEADGEMKPGKKGISLTRDQWEVLLSVASKVNDRLK